MGNFDYKGGKGGGHKGDFRAGGGFKKRSFGGDDDRSQVLYKAVCSECGSACEVPFRPMNGKPVYCKNCFGAKKHAGEERYPAPRPPFGKPEFPPRHERNDESRGEHGRPEFKFKPRQHTEVGAIGGPSNAKQLEMINTKLDRLIKAIEGMSQVKLTPISESTSKAPAKPAPPKTPIKKPTKKPVSKKGKK